MLCARLPVNAVPAHNADHLMHAHGYPIPIGSYAQQGKQYTPQRRHFTRVVMAYDSCVDVVSHGKHELSMTCKPPSRVA